MTDPMTNARMLVGEHTTGDWIASCHMFLTDPGVDFGLVASDKYSVSQRAALAYIAFGTSSLLEQFESRRFHRYLLRRCARRFLKYTTSLGGSDVVAE
jgi:hypothetical protein